MRSINKCLGLPSVYDMTSEERAVMEKWIDSEARYKYDSYDFCCLLGWFVLDDRSVPLSPKEAGFGG